MDYPEHLRNKKNPHDLSLATNKGHSVLRTLIRCYVSPAHMLVVHAQGKSSSGSSDSSVYIYDVNFGYMHSAGSFCIIEGLDLFRPITDGLIISETGGSMVSLFSNLMIKQANITLRKMLCIQFM